MSDIRLKCYFVSDWQHSVLVQNSYTLFNWALLMREIKRKSPKRLRKYVNFLYVWSFPLTLIISCFARKTWSPNNILFSRHWQYIKFCSNDHTYVSDDKGKQIIFFNINYICMNRSFFFWIDPNCSMYKYSQ